MTQCEDCIHYDICTFHVKGNECDKCPHFKNTADVVPKSEVDKLELTLQGVMWSVDKWLDEKDYDADPIKRAITMREKTLKIVENAKAEIAREIFEEIERLCDAHLYWNNCSIIQRDDIAELKKKYEVGKDG